MTQLAIDTTKVSGGQVPGRDTEWARVVENLASNAAWFAESTVGFSVRQLDGLGELVVSDDGPGIPEDLRQRIFERFATSSSPEVDANQSESLRPGVGLGLSIAPRYRSLSRGTISVESCAAGSAGARFVVSCPGRS